MKIISHTTFRSLLTAMIFSAAVAAHGTENRAQPSNMTTNFVSPPAWEEFQLIDWHGRPKRLIGQDPRTYRKAAKLKSAQQHISADIATKDGELRLML